MPPLPPKHNPYLHDLIWQLLRTHNPGALLDIPSGPGYFAQQAQAHGFNAIAAEIDATLHVFPELQYQQVDMAQPMPFAAKQFDYLVSIEGIEHIENQFLFLRECARVLKTDGKLFLTTPNVSSLESRLAFFFTGVHDHPPRVLRDDSPNVFMEHINLIPYHRLETFLRFAGFEIETLTTYKLRKGSLLLYPFVYPLARLRYAFVFNKNYKNQPEAQRYWHIFQQYLSRAVLCGSHNVIVARKR